MSCIYVLLHALPTKLLQHCQRIGSSLIELFSGIDHIVSAINPLELKDLSKQWAGIAVIDVGLACILADVDVNLAAFEGPTVEPSDRAIGPLGLGKPHSCNSTMMSIGIERH